MVSSSVLGYVNYGNNKSSFRLLTQMVTVVLISELTAEILILNIGTSIPPYHFLQPIQVIYFGLIFYHLLRLNQPGKWLLAFSTVSIVITCVFLSLFYQSIYTFPSIGLVLLSLFVVMNCLVLLVQMLNKPSMEPLWKQANFWFAIGNLQFHTITFFSILRKYK